MLNEMILAVYFELQSKNKTRLYCGGLHFFRCRLHLMDFIITDTWKRLFFNTFHFTGKRLRIGERRNEVDSLRSNSSAHRWYQTMRQVSKTDSQCKHSRDSSVAVADVWKLFGGNIDRSEKLDFICRYVIATLIIDL